MICLRNMIIGYHGRSIGIPPINCCFDCGTMTAIIGANGSGKTTLLKTIAGVLPPAEGFLEFKMSKRPDVGYLPQHLEVDREFPLTVFDVVSMGCWSMTGLLKKTNDDQLSIIWESLICVELDAMANLNIGALSDGQFQRMLFARLLVQQAKLVLLDDPFKGIDMHTCDIIMKAVGHLRRDGCIIIVSLHDKKMVSEFFNNVLLLASNCNVWGASLQVMKVYRDIM